VKEDLFCEEELKTVLKGFKNSNAEAADSVVNEFVKYAGFEVRDKLLMIINGRGGVPSNLRNFFLLNQSLS